MENKTICGPAFHVCAPYRCKYKSLRDICVYSDMENKMTEEWMLIKNISCGVSSKVKRHEFSILVNSNGFFWCVKIFDGDDKIAHTGDQRTLFIYRELLGDRCRLGLNSKDSIYCRGVNSFLKWGGGGGGGGTVSSEGFYTEISSQHNKNDF